jgi:hypothetical protein
MKKEKPQQDKAARKKIKGAIQQKIAKALHDITGELKDARITIDIEKEAKKLAKKLTKHLSAKSEAEESVPVAAAPAVLSKQTATSKTRPVAKATALKPAKPVAAKTPAAKPAAAKTAAAKPDVKNGTVKAIKTTPAKAKK